MSSRERSSQEIPRSLKHLAIHVFVDMGFLVFSNIGAKNKIDLIIGLPKSNELRVAGIRIKTGTYSPERKSWYFSEKGAKYFIEKSPFFYVFCLRHENEFKPTFVVISSTDLKDMTSTVKNGNYAIEIMKKQIDGPSKWTGYIDNFDQIKNALL